VTRDELDEKDYASVLLTKELPGLPDDALDISELPSWVERQSASVPLALDKRLMDDGRVHTHASQPMFCSSESDSTLHQFQEWRAH